MNTEELTNLLNKLMSLPAETEWVEFKHAENGFGFDKIGKYFSALSNEANLKHKDRAWLIFGVDNKPKKIIGTKYRPDREHLDSLKKEIADKTTNRITFVDIHELNEPEGRVIMFEIPSAPVGIPVAWEGHYYGRDGESLGSLNIQELDQIRNQERVDWSAQTYENAAIHDLEPEAVKKAREEFKKKNPKIASESDNWNDETFLNKAKLTIKSKITRTAIILLGKPESTHYLNPFVAQISWILKNDKNIEKDYEHFGPPFILNVESAISKIRNLKYRYLPDNTLFPTEITQYEPWVIREALHNCIAHQDYEKQGRITIVENPDNLLFVNSGSFIPQSIESVIEQDAPQQFYRNKFLVEAMANLNMIDIVGSGIKQMFTLQRNRFFPLPDYDLSNPAIVKVRIFGKVLDKNYTQILINKTEMDLKIVILLDKVQKGEKISTKECKTLRGQYLIEGRYPNLFVAAGIADITDQKEKYIRHRGFDAKYYKNLIIDYIKEYKSADRKNINRLLFDKLPEILTDKQKITKIGNLLHEMNKKDATIKNYGSKKWPKWVLSG